MSRNKAKNGPRNLTAGGASVSPGAYNGSPSIQSTVAVLRKTLRGKGLNSRGTKSELLERLQQATKPPNYTAQVTAITQAQAHGSAPPVLQVVSSKFQSSQSAPDKNGGGDSEVVDCRCGSSLDDGVPMVCCVKCEKWSHQSCYCLSEQQAQSIDFLCIHCGGTYPAIPRNGGFGLGSSVTGSAGDGLASLRQEMFIFFDVVKSQMLSFQDQILRLSDLVQSNSVSMPGSSFLTRLDQVESALGQLHSALADSGQHFRKPSSSSTGRQSLGRREFPQPVDSSFSRRRPVGSQPGTRGDRILPSPASSICQQLFSRLLYG